MSGLGYLCRRDVLLAAVNHLALKKGMRFR